MTLLHVSYVGNVQQVLLRALRKRVQPQAEIPKKKRCRIDISRCQMNVLVVTPAQGGITKHVLEIQT